MFVRKVNSRPVKSRALNEAGFTCLPLNDRRVRHLPFSLPNRAAEADLRHVPALDPLRVGCSLASPADVLGAAGVDIGYRRRIDLVCGARRAICDRHTG